MKKLAAIGSLAAVLAVQGAQAADPGTTALAFLKLTSGARPLAMGEAFVGVADDVNAVYTNPAGMGLLTGIHGQFTHQKHFQTINQEVLTYAQSVQGMGTFGINVAALLVSGMDRTFATATGDYDRTEGSFGATDMAITLAYAKPVLISGLNVGASAKVLTEMIDTNNAVTFAGDLGFHYVTSVKGLSAGLVLQNLGAPIQQDPLPMLVKAGAGYRMEIGDVHGAEASAEAVAQPADHVVVGALDAIVPVDNIPTVSVGAEYSFRGMLALRAGFRAGPNIKDLGAGSGLTAGVGFRFKMAAVDLGYQGYGDLGPTVRLSLGVHL